MQYTLITGASAGIGEAFAKQLAAEGQNLILAARRLEKLDALAATLKSDHNIEVHTLQSDLSEHGSGIALAKAIEENAWAIQGLINNAGIGDRGSFESLSLERQLGMIQLNVTSLVELTHALLPTLKQARDAYIINVASTAAFQAGPNMSIYYATKAFVLSFSEGLHEELKSQGIAVSALCPGPTASEFASEANMLDTKLFKAGAMTSEEVARQSLAKRKRAIVITGIKNLIGVWLGKLSPRLVTRKLAGWLQA